MPHIPCETYVLVVTAVYFVKVLLALNIEIQCGEYSTKKHHIIQTTKYREVEFIAK